MKTIGYTFLAFCILNLIGGACYWFYRLFPNIVPIILMVISITIISYVLGDIIRYHVEKDK